MNEEKKLFSELINIDMLLSRLKSLKQLLTPKTGKRLVSYKRNKRTEFDNFNTDFDFTDEYISNPDSEFWKIKENELKVPKYKFFNFCLCKYLTKVKTRKVYKFENVDFVKLALETGIKPFDLVKQSFLDKSKWTEEEDILLKEGILKYTNKWNKISLVVKTKNNKQCCQRAKSVKFRGLHRCKWTEDEDKTLRNAVEKFGCSWSKISSEFLHKTDAQCKERYSILYSNTKLDWTAEEDQKLMQLYEIFGNKWSKISSKFENKSRKSCRSRCLKLKKNKVG